MPDITMCPNNYNCTLAKTCYRFSAIPNQFYQSYADFKQDPKTGKCDQYYERNIKPKPI